ncbi:MAG: thioredoxin [bacterium]|nr:thioredoxin [bacterium]
MPVAEITEADFQEKVINSSTPVLLDLFAQWCGPCKLAEPILEELSKEYEGKVIIAKLDVDKNPKVTESLGVMSIPTTILFKGGEEVGRQVGFAGKQRFEDLIKKAI